MGKAHNVKRRKGKKFNYNANRSRLWKNSKKMPHIKCKAIREAWENNKGVDRNLQEMGLAADPNKIQRIPSAKVQFKETVKKLGPESSSKASTSKQKLRKGFVVDALVKEASKPRETTFHVSNEIGGFAKYMVDKYGDDYKTHVNGFFAWRCLVMISLLLRHSVDKYVTKLLPPLCQAMAKDPRNYYQETPKQIKRKIGDFQVSKYLDALRFAKKLKETPDEAAD